MSRALCSALACAARAQWGLRFGHRPGPRVEHIDLPKPEAVRAGLARRPAAVVPLTLQPVSIARPVRDTEKTIHDFALEQFTPSARRLAEADPRER